MGRGEARREGKVVERVVGGLKSRFVTDLRRPRAVKLDLVDGVGLYFVLAAVAYRGGRRAGHYLEGDSHGVKTKSWRCL